MATLSLAEIPKAEAAEVKEENTIFDIKLVITIAVIFVFAGYGVVEFVKATVNVLVLKVKEASKNEAVTENVNARPSHVDGGYFDVEDEKKTSKNAVVMKETTAMNTGAGSSTDNTALQVVMKRSCDEDVTKEKSQQVQDEYTRQTGMIYKEKNKGRPPVCKESQTYGTPEYFEMMTYWHRQYTNQKVRDMTTQSPVTYTFKNVQPRFTPLGERAHGAWYSVNNFELKS